MKINGYRLPDPDGIGEAQYRVIYDFLEDVLDETEGDPAATEAVEVLYGVQEWCVDLIAKIQATIGKGGE